MGKGIEVSPAVRPGTQISGVPILVQPEPLAQAATSWENLLPPFAPTVAEQLGVSNFGFGRSDLASAAVASATADWPNMYDTRFDQRKTKAGEFVAACGGTASSFGNTDQGSAGEISGAAGPTLV